MSGLLVRVTGVLLVLMGFCGFAGAAVGGSGEGSRPNIVVILVDDMGFSDIGCYGGEIPTPHLDGLAENGVRFTQFYNTARCSPTRASLLTGLYPHQTGMGHLDGMHRPESPGYLGLLNNECVTIAEGLRGAGYFTAMAGKWHLGYSRGSTPAARGFDRNINSAAGGVHFPNQPDENRRRIYLDGEEISPTDERLGDDWYGTELWTEWGLKFIEEARGQEKPFFLYLAHCAPHFPLMARQEDIDRFRGKYLAGWDKLREERYERQKAMGLIDGSWPLSERPEAVSAWEDLGPEERDRFDHIMAIYAAMVYSIDRSVGVLVEGLEERGMLENTLIFFVSDNGASSEGGPQGRTGGEGPLGWRDSNVFQGMSWATLSDTPFNRYKRFTHEGGIATPLIVHWPAGIAGEQNGSWYREYGHVIDIMPTCLEVAGARYPEEVKGKAILPLEGVSLLPALAGGSLGREAPLFFEHEGNRAVRDGKWKLVSKLGEPWELYDMEADRTETRNIIEEHPEKGRELMAAYEAYAARAKVEPWRGGSRNDWGGVVRGRGR